MVQRIKTDLCSLVRKLGYEITDNGAYVEKFPWLMARLGSYNRVDAFNTRIDTITIIIDIFSKYKGEKEILDIVENISNHIQSLRTNNTDIIFISQRDLKILDDNKTGPIKKHGVVSYSFLLSKELEEVEPNDTIGG